MRKLLLSVFVVLLSFAAIAQQEQVIQLSAGENKLELKSVTPEAFSAKILVKELNFLNKVDENGEFSVLNVEGMTRPNNVGQANLPVISKLIEVPYGAEIQVVINGYDEEVINLDDYGINRIEPTQPSYSKSTPEGEYYFVIDNDYYSTDELESTPLVKTEINGVMRGTRMGRIEIRPYHYNPVENTLTVYNNLDFECGFFGADLALTEEMKNKFYTPEFEGSFQTLLNYIAPAAKDAFSNYAAPIKYVIVANSAFEATLEPFVQWKTKQGFNVIEYYVATGVTNTSIKTYLEGLYDAGTPTNPAPLYVLIVGDHSGTYAIPAFASTASTPSSSHITDVYYATYDGSSDYIPDLYYGRISANSTTELSNALNKILPYEQYTLPDPSYMDKCMLIAGVDATFAPSHGDGTIFYGINEYFNEAHGFTNIYAYFHTLTTGPYQVMSSANAAADADIRTKIGAGLGFANYTAHCDYDGWADPNFPRSEIANLNNLNKYPFLVANCCLSFEFNQSDAFGEMIIYAQNEGAIGYIGTSNSSYWDEDVYWGIGLTSIAITTANADNHTYANTGLGAYDGIWHENGEAYSNWYYSGRQIAHKGNLAVEASSSSYKKYYWEIYHLSGDPSILPYMTVPETLSLSITAPMQGATSVSVTTEPYTYVAISKNNVLLDAEWSGAGTTVTLTVPALTGEAYCVVGTKQDRSPYINESVIPTAANPPVAAFSGTPLTILEGQSVTFTDASQYAASWAWNFGDSQTATVQNPVHTYTTAGTYTVSLTVTNGMGSDNETKVNYITVNANTNPPTAQFVASATSINVGASINFTDLSTNNPTTWAWTFEGGSPATSSLQNPTGITYPAAGTYSVTLTASNGYGADDEIKTGYIVVTVPDYCTSTFTNTGGESITKVMLNTINNTSGNDEVDGYEDFTAISTDVYPDDTYVLSVTINTAGNYTDYCQAFIDWNMNGLFTDAGETYNVGSITNVTAGVLTTNVTVPSGAVIGSTRMRVNIEYNVNPGPCDADHADEWGETEDYTINVLSNTNPPVANFTSDITSTCTGAIQFTDASTGADSWSWNFGDGGTSTEQNPLYTYATNGTFTVSLTATNAYGTDVFSISDMITVDMPIAPTTTGASSCGPATLTLNASGSGTLVWYDAATGGTEVTTGASYTTAFANTTTYYVENYIPGAVQTVGPAVGGASRNVAAIEYFDVYEQMTLVSVQAMAGTAGNKTITLLDNLGNTVHTASVNVGTTTTTVTLNWVIEPGTGYQLLTPVNSTLYRINGGITYPYTIPDLVSITGCDIGSTYFYSWFNWTVESMGCSSPRTPVTATINTIPTDVTVTGGGTQCGGSMTLNATGGTGGTIYWQNTTSNGTSTVTASSSQTVSANGTYYFRAQSAAGCWGNQGSASVTINPVPAIVSVSGGGTQCGGSMTLTATGGTGGTIYWQGTTSGGTSTTTASSSQTVSASGTYYFRSQSALGCWGPEGSATVTINPLPSDVTVTGGGTQCGGSMTLNATGGTGGTIYWQNTTTNGTSTATASTSQAISSDGTYYFRAMSGAGCWGNQGSATVTIYPSFTASATATDETAVGANDGSVTVNMTGGTPNFDGSWSNGGSTSTNGYSMIANGLAGGNYTVTVEDANGCTASAGATVNTIGAVPVAAFTADVTEGCDNLTVNFTDLSNNTPTSWAWDFGDGNTSNLQNPSHTYSVSGVYTVTLTVSNFNGPDAETLTNYITVGETPVIVMSMTEESLVGNDGTATAEVTGGALPYFYVWSNLAGNTETISGLIAGEYCVTVTEDLGCEASACITVTQVDPLSPPVADFVADEIDACGTLTVQFTDLSTNTPTTWSWNFGDGGTSTEQNPEYTYSVPGIYTVVLSVSNADGDDTEFKAGYITVFEVPEVVVDAVQASGEFVADGSASVTVTGGADPYTIDWSTSETGTSISDLVPGDYSVVVTDDNGCIVTEPFVISWTNSIAEESYILSIFPNPAKEFVTIVTDGGVADNISVTNLLGQSVINVVPNSNVTKIDVNILESGIYFVKVSVDNKEFSRKIIIGQ